MDVTTSPGTRAPTRAPTPRQELVAGARAALAVAIGYVPFALAIGATVSASGTDLVVGWASAFLVFAGAAQVAAITMLDSDAALGVVVATGLVINARHLLYSAALAPTVRQWRPASRWAAGYLLADPVYALAAARYEQGPLEPRLRQAYYFGVGLTAIVAWTALIGAGVLVAGAVPTQLPLGLAAPLTFLLLLLPSLVDRARYVAAGVGGAVALLASGLPLGLGLLVGAGAGIAAGAAVAGRTAEPARGVPGEVEADD
jgi:predicted branched-subunit amino acid permease